MSVDFVNLSMTRRKLIKGAACSAAAASAPSLVNHAFAEQIAKLEKEKKIFVLRPSQLIPIGRLEKDKEVIQQMYDLGVNDCKNQLKNLKKYLRG